MSTPENTMTISKLNTPLYKSKFMNLTFPQNRQIPMILAMTLMTTQYR